MAAGSWHERHDLVSATKTSLSVITRELCLAVGTTPTPTFCEFLVTQNEQHNPEIVAPTCLANLNEWAPQCPLFSRLWDHAFASHLIDPAALASPLSSLPEITYPIPESQSTDPCLLSPLDLLALSQYIKPNPTTSLPSPAPTRQYPLLYSSRTHGKSWNAFTTRTESAGSVILLVKTDSGALFGAYIPTSLETSPKFQDHSDTFLFTLHPTLRVFLDAGVNRNHWYFNYGMSTLPNGIGFGGQFDYFGVWIDPSLESGKCCAEPTSSTFQSPKMDALGTREGGFGIDDVQVLLVEPKEVDERLVPDKKGKGGIVNSNPVESALLEMAGKEMHRVE
ncbi:hypothetical protein HDU98_004519 [Podochytrium sp. JEL0797]|nr:hypothetical protein HDU98_004519 [Podochytrium sp. JEL0797]